MQDFLKFFDEKRKTYPMRLEIYCSKTMDWVVSIYRDGLIVTAQHCDMEYCFAKAHVDLKEWLLENEGGY